MPMSLREGERVRVKAEMLERGRPLSGSNLKGKILRVESIGECYMFGGLEASCRECPGKVYLIDDLGRPVKESGCWGYTEIYALEKASSNRFIGTKIRKEI